MAELDSSQIVIVLARLIRLQEEALRGTFLHAGYIGREG